MKENYVLCSWTDWHSFQIVHVWITQQSIVGDRRENIQNIQRTGCRTCRRQDMIYKSHCGNQCFSLLYIEAGVGPYYPKLFLFVMCLHLRRVWLLFFILRHFYSSRFGSIILEMSSTFARCELSRYSSAVFCHGLTRTFYGRFTRGLAGKATDSDICVLTKRNILKSA